MAVIHTPEEDHAERVVPTDYRSVALVRDHAEAAVVDNPAPRAEEVAARFVLDFPFELLLLVGR